MSLRIKLMLALLLTGLSAVALVGGLAYYGVNKKVDILRRQDAADHFYRFMSGYLQQYGSWQAASAAESFDNYVQRMNRRERASGRADEGQSANGGPDQRPAPPDDGQGPPPPPRPDDGQPDVH